MNILAFAADMRASLSVPSFYNNFDIEANTLISSKIQKDLQQAVQLLAA
jgi:hypothetical protein